MNMFLHSIMAKQKFWFTFRGPTTHNASSVPYKITLTNHYLFLQKVAIYLPCLSFAFQWHVRIVENFFIESIMRGFLKGRNTEIGLFSRRSSGKLYIFWRISNIGILADTGILYFENYLTDILKTLERKSEITSLGNPPPYYEDSGKRKEKLVNVCMQVEKEQCLANLVKA